MTIDDLRVADAFSYMVRSVFVILVRLLFDVLHCSIMQCLGLGPSSSEMVDSPQSILVMSTIFVPKYFTAVPSV